jgi:hypothetical protein
MNFYYLSVRFTLFDRTWSIKLGSWCYDYAKGRHTWGARLRSRQRRQSKLKMHSISSSISRTKPDIELDSMPGPHGV